MTDLHVDISKLKPFINEASIKDLQAESAMNHDLLATRTGKGNEFLGWIDLPVQYDPALVERIQSDAEKVRQMAEVFVVIGIGGSYLGSRAVIEALENPFESSSEGSSNPQIVFAGENLSEDYHARLLAFLDRKEYAVAVISKSGTTTEPAIAFRLIRQHIEKKYGREEARRRIFAITDASKGALKKVADTEGYSSYIIPDDVGGRYSVLTPVGLLPVAVAGFDIRSLLDGAARMRETALASPDFNLNPCTLYAAVRNILYRQGKVVEILASFEPNLLYKLDHSLIV